MGEWNQLHNTVIVHRYAIELAHLILFKTFLNRPTTKEAAEGWERAGERVRGIEVWVTVALPLHLRAIRGLICLARCLCTLLLLVTFWCHGVTVKWLPSHVAARGGATSGTMRPRRVGARTQEAPAGRNALTLPPPRLPWNRELVEALLTTSQCLCVPGSSQGPARTQGEDRHTHRHSNQKMGAARVKGGNLYVRLWPVTHTQIKLCLTHETQCGSLISPWQSCRGSSDRTEALPPWCPWTTHDTDNVQMFMLPEIQMLIKWASL